MRACVSAVTRAAALSPSPIKLSTWYSRRATWWMKLDLDQLYDEAGNRRRMMSVSAHDRISGSPQMVRAWDEFLTYAKKAGRASRSCART